MIHSDKETRNLRHVSIKWTTPDRTKKDMEYKLSIKDDSRTTNWTTEVPHINLNLTVGVLYTATVFSQRCNGGLRSNFSVPLDIFLEEIRVPESSKIPDSTSGNPKQTSGGSTSKRSDFPVGEVVGGVVGGVVVVAVVPVVPVVIIIICVILVYKRRNKRCAENGENFEMLASLELDESGVGDYVGEQLTETEKRGIVTVKKDENRKKSGVGGLCIDGNKTYYSCCEKYESKAEEMYTLHVLKPDGELILGGFKHIRGIEKDSNNCYYVVDSSHKRVLKFDSNWNPLRRTSRNSTEYGTVLSEPFGILATQEYVFVCAYRNKQICIFDHELSLHYRITHDYLLSGPTDIAVFRNTFFVTIKSSIIVFQIDFDSKTYKAMKMDSFVTNRKTEIFKQALELRGICACKQYLYVAESSGRLLCLEYDFENSRLVYVDSIPKCCPVVVVHDAGTIYYSRRTTEGKFTIARVHHDSVTNKMETKDLLTID
ncbi:hypothetical protein GBAR_LOCUS21172 [Geodia barretti]|uniref:Fibronectin type-III domain-containing protein n=1 Tax=Geodia barretti TaxID=519541 RepID=A0AA35SXF4_GEOBA|nr:hypothetical protein GBAR_LOCUS21172 [Geodia barretti]